MAQYTPALDFLRRVQVWQDAPGGTAGLAVPMADREETTLEGLLAQAQQPGASLTLLDIRARTWLVGYREMGPPLTAAQRDELDAVISQTASYPDRAPQARRHPPHGWRRVAILTVSAAIGLALAGVTHYIAREGDSPAQPPGNSRPLPPQQQVPAALTQLQQFERDWQVTAVAQASAGKPGTLVLLMNGLYYPSGWSLPATDPAWVPDAGGHVTLVVIQGGSVTFADSDGNQWTVGAGQPFVLASDPGTVLQAGRSGDILTMPATHAVVIRRPA